MTRREMSELFLLMRLAWPNAPMFQPDKMKPTIILWAACLPDVDFLTGQAAVVRLCRECKFPPTIAEMREAAEGVRKEIESRVTNAYYIADAQKTFGNGYTPHMFMEERRQALLEDMAREMRRLPAQSEERQ